MIAGWQMRSDEYVGLAIWNSTIKSHEVSRVHMRLAVRDGPDASNDDELHTSSVMHTLFVVAVEGESWYCDELQIEASAQVRSVEYVGDTC